MSGPISSIFFAGRFRNVNSGVPVDFQPAIGTTQTFVAPLQYQYDWFFKPPSNLAGKVCYLTVNRMIVKESGDIDGILGPAYIQASFAQPTSQQYFTQFGNTSGVTTPSNEIHSSDCNNAGQTIGIFFASTNISNGGQADSNPNPRVLVEVPHGPQVIRLTFGMCDGTAPWSVQLNVGDHLSSFVYEPYIALAMEFEPID